MFDIEHPDITHAQRTGWPSGAAAVNQDRREDRAEYAQERFKEFLAFAEDGDPDLLEHFVDYMGPDYQGWLN